LGLQFQGIDQMIADPVGNHPTVGYGMDRPVSVQVDSGIKLAIRLVGWELRFSGNTGNLDLTVNYPAAGNVLSATGRGEREVREASYPWGGQPGMEEAWAKPWQPCLDPQCEVGTPST
jgi:hypothetical protein